MDWLNKILRRISGQMEKIFIIAILQSVSKQNDFYMVVKHGRS